MKTLVALYVMACCHLSAADEEQEAQKQLPLDFTSESIKSAHGDIVLTFDEDVQVIELPGQDELFALPEGLLVRSYAMTEDRDSLLLEILRRVKHGFQYHSTLELQRKRSGGWESRYLLLPKTLGANAKKSVWIGAISDYDAKLDRAIVGIAWYHRKGEDGRVRRSWEVWNTRTQSLVERLVEPSPSLDLDLDDSPKLQKANNTLDTDS